MVKLTKYLKPFALSIAAVIVLLFAQAQCELALPDYMISLTWGFRPAAFTAPFRK